MLSIVNDLISSEDVSVGTKYASTRMTSDYLRMVIGANPPWKLPTTWDERRYLILNPSQERIGDREYYIRLADAINNVRVLEKLHWFFMHVNIDDFDTHKIPYTDAMIRNRLEGLRGVELWAFELAVNGFVDAWKIDGDAYIIKDRLRQSYNEFHKARYDDKKEIDAVRFGMELGRLLPALDGNGNIILKRGQIVSILQENRQRNSAILKQRPDLQLDETKLSYSYVLPSLWDFRNLIKMSLKIEYDWNSANSWDYSANKPF